MNAANVAPMDLAIEGLSCAACVRRVELAIAAVPGVLTAQVNLASERARVEGGEPAAILAAIARAGYSGHRLEGAQPTSPPPFFRVVACALLTAPLLPGMVWPQLMLAPALQCTLAGIVLFGFGAGFFRGAYRALRAGSGTMDLLVAIGTGAAFVLSLVLWIRAGPGQMPMLHFDSAAIIVTFVLLGRTLELRARRQSADALGALLRLRPDTIRLTRGGAEIAVPVAEARVGDRAILLPGDRIPLDGRVLAGEAAVDEAMLTGESLPVTKTPGDRVTGGAMNLDGRLEFEVTATGQETTLARIVRLVENAQAAKPPIQQLVDRVSAVFIPVVLLVALATFLLWWWLTGHPTLALLNAVSVLVIACPCALGLATPMAIMIGTGAAARAGILIRDAEALDRAHTTKLVIFDKTGTLTVGRPQLTAATPLADIPVPELRALAGALQFGSEHPLAIALRPDGPALPMADFRAYPGRGIGGTVAGRRLLLGNQALLHDHGLAVAATGETTSWLAELDPPHLLGAFTFTDTIRPRAAAAIARLRTMGLEVAMLSGDSRGAVNTLAATLGIHLSQGGLLPDGKVAALQAFRTDYPTVAMVGDGINDAPALAAADLGIAMANGSDIALQSAGMTLMRSDPALVADAIDIARRTRATIRQGLFWAFAYNTLGLPLAAMGLLSPGLAGTAMALSSLCVVGNALRLKAWRPNALG